MRIRHHPHARRTTLTARGAAMLLAGGALILVGVLPGVPLVVFVGSALTVAPTLSWCRLRLDSIGRGRSDLVVERRVHPAPATAGNPSDVLVQIRAPRATTTASQRLHGVAIAEQVDPGLRAGGTVGARIRASFAEIELRYRVTPMRRGRWTLGPALAHRVDALGLARSQAPLGPTAELTVWPRLLASPSLRGRGGIGLDPQRAGASAPSDEDTTLRLYHPGDDLRRVHWVSAARHQQLMVRAQDGSSPAPVCVLVDPPPDRGLPTDDDLLEWTVSVAATLAVRFLDAGHAVRLVATTRELDQPGLAGSGSGRAAWVRPRADDAVRTLLDQTVDLAPAGDDARSEQERAAVVAAALSAEHGDETVVAVLTDGAAADAAGPFTGGAGGRRSARTALVTTRAEDSGASVEALTLAGWDVAVLPVDSTLDGSWDVLGRGTR
ncbi:MAG: DUF58 domain-containing protein [Cellulomonadaceae bacterium]